MLQELLNTYGDSSPIMILGDFNTTLPQFTQLSRYWYRQSFMLYEFLTNNELYVANFDFKHNVNYTYFKGDVSSYIDHCVVSGQLRECVSKCRILSDNHDATSDHYPLEILVNLQIQAEVNVDFKNSFNSLGNNNNVYVNWRNVDVKAAYRDAISALSSDIQTPSNINVNENPQCYIDRYYDIIVNTMLSASNQAMKAVKTRQSNVKGKHWWNADCRHSRNKHRFWFQLWRSCGKPREGAVYDVYKYSKYVFRKACRLAVSSSINKYFSNCDMLFRQKRIGAFLK